MKKAKSINLPDVLSSESRLKEKQIVYRYFIKLFGIITAWSTLFIILIFMQFNSEKEITRNLALKEAISIYNADFNFRLWATSHGGLYIPVTEELKPNPYLVNIPEQNIETDSGKKLTLMNPAWALRNLNEFNSNSLKAVSHITSLNLLRPENAPDEWEVAALKTFEIGNKEVAEISKINEVPFFRYMKPLLTESGCLKCHAYQGYKVGDIRGGISISVPFSPYLDIEQTEMKNHVLSYAVVYFLSLLFIIVSSIIIRKRNYVIYQTRNLLVNSYASLEEEVFNSNTINEKLKLEIINHKKAEKELKEAYEIINRSSSVVILWKNDSMLSVDFISKNIDELIGYSADEILAGNILFSSIIHPDDQERVFKKFAEITSDSDSISFNPYRLISKNDSIKWISSKTAFRRDSIGKITHIEGIISDITEIRKSELKLRNLEAAIDQSPISIVITDTSGDIEYVNKYTSIITGYSEDELIGNNPKILQSGEMSRDKYVDMWETIQSGREWRGRFHNKKKNGELYWEDALIAPIFSINREISHYLAVKEDITERIVIEEEKERLQSQLNQKNKMDGLGQLAGGIAHDFNNILYGISSSAQLLQLPERSLDKNALKYVDMIIHASTRAADLTNKLLTYSRKDKSSFKIVDVHNIVNISIDILKNTINKKIELIVDKTAENFMISGDESGFENSLINLVLNASQAISDKGKIHVITKNVFLDQKFCNSCLFEVQPGEFCEIEVRDTGSGIPEDKLDKIFEPFYTTKEPGEGTGLGLTTVYSTIQNHNGSLSINSVPGSGTSIKILFPCVESIVEKKQNGENISIGTGKILFVDDEEINRIVGAEILESLGYQVLVAENGAEALEIYKMNFPEIEVVLLDMIMPVMDGRETFTKLKDFDEKCKVVISSGYTKNENIDEMIDAGLSGFIKKPYKISELSQILTDVIKN